MKKNISLLSSIIGLFFNLYLYSMVTPDKTIIDDIDYTSAFSPIYLSKKKTDTNKTKPKGTPEEPATPIIIEKK